MTAVKRYNHIIGSEDRATQKRRPIFYTTKQYMIIRPLYIAIGPFNMRTCSTEQQSLGPQCGLRRAGMV